MVGKVGPWGGDGGVSDWEFQLGGNCKLTKIKVVITEESCLSSMRFTYLDANQVEYSDTYGADNDGFEFIIPRGEKITEISGTYGSHKGCTVITSLGFKVGEKKKGPYGNQSGTPFSLPVGLSNVTGFFGKNGAYFDSFGVILSRDYN